MPTIIFALLIQPLLAVVVILILRRRQVTTRLVPALVLSGVAGAILVALFAFMRSTVPIAPYELSRDAWNPIYRQTLLSLYIGFGAGVNLAALIGIPFVFYQPRGK
jgi:hypothetical protein